MKKQPGIYLCSFLFLFFSIAWADSSESFSVEKAQPHIWHLKSKRLHGTGFFISPRHMVTNFHVAGALTSLDNVLLSHHERPETFKVKRVLALSAVSDLALLEIDSDLDSYLEISQIPVDDKDEVFIAGYPRGSFQALKALSSKQQVYQRSFTMEQAVFPGMSGAPILNSKGQVVGVVSTAQANTTQAISSLQLQNLMEGNEGVDCREIDWNSCIQQAVLEIQEKAEKAEPGFVEAQFFLAIMYMKGNLGLPGASEITRQVQQLIQEHAEKGLPPPSRMDIGRRLRDFSMEQASHWLSESAKWGHAPSQTALGEQYLKEFNKEEGLYWLSQAAEQDYAPAQNALGEHYKLERDFETANEFFRKAWSHAYIPAQHHLGLSYYFGQAVPQDDEEALHRLHQAADYDFVPAQVILMRLYFDEKRFEPKDYQRVVALLNRLAEKDHPAASFYLAKLYYEGRHIAQDYSRVVGLLKKSIALRYPPANHMMGELYKEGKIVPKNYDMARNYFMGSAGRGYRPSIIALNELTALLDRHSSQKNHSYSGTAVSKSGSRQIVGTAGPSH